MLGVYNYTVVLTYMSVVSAVLGIFVSLSGTGHPYIGTMFLLFCGLCDAFDGKVASTKKNRSKLERNFGIQIDSLSDVLAFGVLPACIGVAIMRTSPMLKTLCLADGTEWYGDLIKYALYAVLVVYALAALIRLAYFNVTEEERQLTEDGPRKYYVGLPVTSAALIVPAAAIIRFICSYFFDISFLFYAIMLVTAIAFVSSFKIKKFGIVGILVLIGIGAAICVTFLLFRFVFYANLKFF